MRRRSGSLPPAPPCRRSNASGLLTIDQERNRRPQRRNVLRRLAGNPKGQPAFCSARPGRLFGPPSTRQLRAIAPRAMARRLAALLLLPLLAAAAAAQAAAVRGKPVP